MARIAVLTGDLIGSTSVSDLAGFRNRLSELLWMFEHDFGAATTLFRGDGFQIAVDVQTNAFKSAIILRTGLIRQSPASDERWDARVAIAFSERTASADDQNSPAYVNSGRALDQMGKEAFCIHHDDPMMKLALGTASSFADQFLSQMTPVEAEVLHLYFLKKTSHQQIADEIGKKRSTVTEALKRANYTLFEKYVTAMSELEGRMNV